MTKISVRRHRRICQGDIFHDVEHIEHVKERGGIVEVSKIIFPNIVVLTQDCDLEQDFRFRKPSIPGKTQDKLLISVLVAPIYNAEHVFLGEHMSALNMKMEAIKKGKSAGTFLKNNERPRYHYLDFPQSPSLVDSVVDFKHYFSLNIHYLMRIRSQNFVCRLAELHREDLSQRFAAYLSRIGLPDIVPKLQAR